MTDQRIYHNDCRTLLPRLPDDCIHMVLTDPPYFLHGLDADWKTEGKRTHTTGSFSGYPNSMPFDPRQGVNLQAFMTPIFKECFRVLIRGAFALVFSQPRLAHRMGMALEEAGFHIRDTIVWQYEHVQSMKAFSFATRIKNRGYPPEEEAALLAHLGSRKTPQMQAAHETIIMAQKPPEGGMLDCWLKHSTGLMDASRNDDGAFPANLRRVAKVRYAQKVDGWHFTQKPIDLLRPLIEELTLPNQIVLDPFAGSGSTLVAAREAGRRGIGMEVHPEYARVARKRLRQS